MPTIEDAIALAAEAHAGQTDKAGAPYILHLLRVMQAQESTEARMAGVLHDLVEDTTYTFEDLEEMGYPGQVIEALRHVTKRDGEPYADFAKRAGDHPIAWQVKIADLEDNMDVTRLDSVGEGDTERLDKYLRAHRRLTDGEETGGQNRESESSSRKSSSRDRRKAALIQALQDRTPEMEEWIGRMDAPNPLYKREGFVWRLLLQSFATWGNSRGFDGLINTEENYRRVTYERLEEMPVERRVDHIEDTLREAKVYAPVKKAPYLSTNVEIIREMGGLKAAGEKALARPDADSKIEFMKQFKGIGDKYARNSWMDARHPDFRNKVAIDQRIRGITELLGREFDGYKAHEDFYLEIAGEAGVTGWELDRLLYNFTDRFEAAIKSAAL